MNSKKLKIMGSSALLVSAFGMSAYSFFDALKYKDITGVFCLLSSVLLFIILVEYVKEIKEIEQEDESYFIAEWDDTNGNR